MVLYEKFIQWGVQYNVLELNSTGCIHDFLVIKDVLNLILAQLIKNLKY